MQEENKVNNICSACFNTRQAKQTTDFDGLDLLNAYRAIAVNIITCQLRLFNSKAMFCKCIEDNSKESHTSCINKFKLVIYCFSQACTSLFLHPSRLKVPHVIIIGLILNNCQ